MKTDIENQLTELAKKAFESHSFNFFPLFPNVLIRIFDYEDLTYNSRSLIIKPNSAQAPNHKAVVVRTWEPKEVETKQGTFTLESELQSGDLITVPYWAGVPTGQENLDDSGYRVVPENKARNYKTGAVIANGSSQADVHIFFKQTLFDKRLAVIDLLTNRDYDVLIDGDKTKHNLSATIDKILADYDIVPKRLTLAQSQVPSGEAVTST